MRGTKRDMHDADSIRNVRSASSIRKALCSVMPELDEDVVAGLAVDLADFQSIAEKHVTRVREIKRLSSSKQRGQLAEMLTDFWYGDLVAHLPYHLKHMRRTLPDIIDALERNKSIRRFRKRPRATQSSQPLTRDQRRATSDSQ